MKNILPIFPVLLFLLCGRSPEDNYQEFDCNNASIYLNQRVSDSLYYLVLEIQDINHNLKRKAEGESFSNPTGKFNWNGMDSTGQQCLPGIYYIKLSVWYGISDSSTVACTTYTLQ